MKQILFLVGLFALSAPVALADEVSTNVTFRTADAVLNATDTVIASFGAVSGVNSGNPYLRVDAVVAAFRSGPSLNELLVDKVLETDADVQYLVRPKSTPVASGAGIGRQTRTTASIEIPDLRWGKTYTFIVLNYTGGTSSRHTSIYTYSVPLFQ
jgi:hypothetical protein